MMPSVTTPRHVIDNSSHSLETKAILQPLGYSRCMHQIIAQHRQALTLLCRRYDVRLLEVFGSVTGEAFEPARSDVDFLVTFNDTAKTNYADTFAAFADALEATFGRKIDLLTHRSVRNPYFRQAVEASKETVFSADPSAQPYIHEA